MKKNIQRWIASVVFFAVSFLFSLWFLYKKTLGNLFLLFLLLALASVLYVYSNKRIMLPGGYTAIQARQFYAACLKAGADSDLAFFKDKERQKELVQKFEFSRSLDEKEIRRLYYDGKQIYELMKRKK